VGSPTIDGVIDDSEYEYGVELSGGDFNIYWQINGTNIIIGLKAKTDGWVSLGIEPTTIMKDADMIFGWVDSDGNAGMLDCFSTGRTGPHPPDEELGGSFDIDNFSGTENGGWTEIEFSRALSTGDKYDKDIKAEGKVRIIWAYGSSDGYTVKHIERGGVNIDFATGDATETVPWYFHAAWMIAGFVLMLIGIVIVRYKKTKPWRIKVHRSLLILGGVSAVLGLVSGIYMVTLSGGGHFKVPHAYVGIITVIFILYTLRLGFVQFKAKPDKIKILKLRHKWFGRITAVLMLINIVLGLVTAGII
jgi:uncharacterized membrane protein YozB (DUF420 family)